MKCLILAGGFATRLYPLTINRAKALLEYRGKPVISHVVERVPLDIEIMVSTNRKFENDFIKWQQDLGRRVEICIEQAVTDEQKLGAVGAIDFWVRNKPIREDLMVVAADNYFELELHHLIHRFNGRNPLIAVYDVGEPEKACEIARACQVGLVILDEDRVVRLDEKPEIATSSVIATGIYILPARIFTVLSEYCAAKKRDNMGSFISYLLDKEEVHAYPFTRLWVDIGDEIKRGRVAV